MLHFVLCSNLEGTHKFRILDRNFPFNYNNKKPKDGWADALVIMIAKLEKNAHSGTSLAWVGQYTEYSNQLHIHLECEILLCSRGLCIVTVEETNYELLPGMGVFIGSKVPHSIRSDKDSVILDGLVDSRLLRNIVSTASLKSPMFYDKYNAQEKLLDICKELKEKPLYYADCVNAIIIHLAAEIFRGEPTVWPKSAPADAMANYKALLHMIDEQHEFLTFSEAASYMNMSKAYFSRYFKRYTGVTFSEYLTLVKVSQAVSLLKAHPDSTCTDLMIACGFSSLSHLLRSFKSVTGYSPKRLPYDYSINIKDYTARSERFNPNSEQSIIPKTSIE